MNLKKTICLLMGVMIVMSLFGCGKPKYKLILDGYGLRSSKTSYAEGEQVTFTFDMIATDTDYRFFADTDDVKLKQEFDGNHGYKFTFTMPAHDVKISMSSKNSMEIDPSAGQSESTGAANASASPEDCMTGDNIVFDYYEAIVATVNGDHSLEYVLYKYNGSQLVLAQYTKEYDSEERMTFRIVPSSVLDDCMKEVRKHKMDKWEKGRGLNGKVYAVRFLKNGEIKRVSSDNMPENGRAAFDSLEKILVSAWVAAKG